MCFYVNSSNYNIRSSVYCLDCYPELIQQSKFVPIISTIKAFLTKTQLVICKRAPTLAFLFSTLHSYSSVLTLIKGYSFGPPPRITQPLKYSLNTSTIGFWGLGGAANKSNIYSPVRSWASDWWYQISIYYYAAGMQPLTSWPRTKPWREWK